MRGAGICPPDRARREIGELPLGIHLHDTRGPGGCPFAPGATGNVVFEDLVYLCERKGFATGIDLDALIAVRDIARTEMPDEPLVGALARAGTPELLD